MTAVHFPLLTNGLDFILSAVEHLRGTATERDLKYAVLHLCSGIELILKERLKREHWSLIFDNPNTASKSAYEAGDFSSVNFANAISRLTNISGIVIPEQRRKALKLFRDKRNRLEHFGIVDTKAALTASAAEALSIVLDFINEHLDPVKFEEIDAGHLDDIRKGMTEFQAFAKERMKSIEGQLRAATSAIATCPRCRMDASVLDDGADCLFCGHKAEAEAAADEYLSEILGECEYETVKDGGVWPRYECPSCERETLVVRKTLGGVAPTTRYLCFGCGESWKEGALAFCSDCGRPSESVGEGLSICSSCFECRVDRAG